MKVSLFVLNIHDRALSGDLEPPACRRVWLAEEARDFGYEGMLSLDVEGLTDAELDAAYAAHHSGDAVAFDLTFPAVSP